MSVLNFPSDSPDEMSYVKMLSLSVGGSLIKSSGSSRTRRTFTPKELASSLRKVDVKLSKAWQSARGVQAKAPIAALLKALRRTEVR